MSLLDQQMTIGRCLRAGCAEPLGAPTIDLKQTGAVDPEELAKLAELLQSPGFDFTRRVQRSWCLTRTEAGAKLTLSILPPEQRRQLVESWVAAGGGTAFDPSNEAEAFLEYIASRLADPSHELTVCRMEQAIYKASQAALDFIPPDAALLDRPAALLRAGTGAALVRFFAEPQRLFEAIQSKTPLPPLSSRWFPVLFAPGLPMLFRVASKDEAALWEKLARPIAVRLLAGDHATRKATETLFSVGAAEPAGSRG
jgi:hypothetical protein